MSPLEGFLATWSQAHQTFGQGLPAAGSQFDSSAVLRGLKAQVESAAPGERWVGAAATSYGAANAEQAELFEKLADLDARLAAEIDRSAQVVISGRADLDSVRDLVVSAASSAPGGRNGQVMPIVSEGLGQLSSILEKANLELNAIGDRIQQIGTEYAGLAQQR